MRLFFMSGNKGNSISLFGLNFKHPVGLAAGFDKNAEAFDMLGAMGFSFVEIGAVTPRPQKGNPKPRLFRLPEDKALINRMGFNNKGVAYAVERLKKRNPNLIVGANIGKNTDTPNEKANDDYFRLFHALYPFVDYFTVNVSCPNVSSLAELQDKESLLELLEGLQKINKEKGRRKPLLLKISPDLNWKQIDETLEVIEQTGIDGIVAVNTTALRPALTSSPAMVKSIGKGGLSGKPLKDRSTEIIRYVHNKTNGNLPVIGVGGIMNARDAAEKLEAGASLVQVFTGLIYEGPGLVNAINREINKKTTGNRTN